MIHRLFNVLCVCLILVLGSDTAKALTYDEIIEKDMISIAVYRDFPPFSYRKNNKLVGVDVEIAKVIADKMGVKLNLIEQTADENVDDDLRNAIWKGHYLGGQVADIMLHIPYDKKLEKRNELVVLFAPYYVEDIILARDLEKLGPGATLAHFRYEKIAVEIDSLSDFYLSGAFGGSIRENVKFYRNMVEAGQDVVDQKAFGLMGTRSTVEHALAGHHEKYEMDPVPLPGLLKQNWLLGLAVKTDYRQLGYAVGDIIGEMVTSGQMKEIFNRHGLSYVPPSDDFYN